MDRRDQTGRPLPTRRTGLALGAWAFLALPAWSDDRPAGAPEEAPSVQRARDDVELLEAQVARKRAELKEAEVKLEQAKRRLAAAEGLNDSEIRRAQDRLAWAESMYEKGYVSKSQLVADRERLELLKARRLGKRPAKAEGPTPP